MKQTGELRRAASVKQMWECEWKTPGKRCGCVLVVDGGMKLLGTFTDGDLRRKLGEHGGSAGSSVHHSHTTAAFGSFRVLSHT